MMSNEFKAALDRFLEGKEADAAHQALYDITRAAFLAGWCAAGGEPPQARGNCVRRTQEARFSPFFFARQRKSRWR